MSDPHKDGCYINYGGMCNCDADEAMCPTCDQIGCREHERKNRKFKHLSEKAVNLDWYLVHNE